MAEYIQGALSAGIFHPHHILGPITKPSQSMMGGLSLLHEDCPPEQHLKNPVHFTSPRSLFKRGRSCADIVHTWDKIGIDMSRAFDTIKRSEVLELLDQAQG